MEITECKSLENLLHLPNTKVLQMYKDSSDPKGPIYGENPAKNTPEEANRRYLQRGAAARGCGGGLWLGLAGRAA
ncbi:hypothetical protein LguiB_013158 [Lonicera macranthoides]